MYNRQLVFTATFLGILVFGAGITTLGSIIPWLTERFTLDTIQTATIFSMLPIGILTGSLFFGPICDRYGYKYLLIVSCLLMFTGFQGIAFLGSLSLMKLAVFLFGIGGGAVNGATSAAVADISKQSKSGNLSLLGLFFGIGALGTPFILASLSKIFSYQQIISVFGWISLAIAVFYLFISFPPSKPGDGISLSKISGLFTDGIILPIAFFLFCQSAFEGIMNNWTTSYLAQVKSMTRHSALYALSLHVIGYTVVRLLLGTVFRSIPVKTIIFCSLALLLAGDLILYFAEGYVIAVTGLIIMGAGLSAGFPLMLGLIGSRYAALSGTAFSFVLVIALIGNMLINIVVGFITGKFGMHQFTSVAFTICALMLVLAVVIFRKKANK